MGRYKWFCHNCWWQKSAKWVRLVTIQQLPLYGLFTIGTLLAAPGTRTVQVRSNPPGQRLSWSLIATVVVLYAVFQFALAKGIPIPPDPETFFVT